MQGIADASGGNYYYVDNPGDMSRIFQQEAGAILRSAARSTDVDLRVPPGLDARGRDRLRLRRRRGRVYVRLGSIPHGEERYVVFRFRGGPGGRLPIGRRLLGPRAPGALRRRRARPGYDAARGGRDSWALELAGRAEAASGPAGVDGLGRQRQRGVRDLAARVHARASSPACASGSGPQALAAEDKMLLDAQTESRPQGRAGRPPTRSWSGGVGGLMSFGKQQAVSNATTAVAYNIDKAFQPARAHRPVVTFEGRGRDALRRPAARPTSLATTTRASASSAPAGRATR